jgi:hypothetical protein
MSDFYLVIQADGETHKAILAEGGAEPWTVEPPEEIMQGTLNMLFSGSDWSAADGGKQRGLLKRAARWMQEKFQYQVEIHAPPEQPDREEKIY